MDNVDFADFLRRQVVFLRRRQPGPEGNWWLARIEALRAERDRIFPQETQTGATGETAQQVEARAL